MENLYSKAFRISIEYLPFLKVKSVLLEYSKTCVKQSLKKLDRTKTLMTSGSLMKVESITQCSPWSILRYFWPTFSDNCSWKPFFGLFKSGCFTQVLLYAWLMACSVYIVVDSDYKWSGKLKFLRNDFRKYKKNLSIKTWNALCNKSIKFQSSIHYLDKMHFKAKLPIFILFVYENDVSVIESVWFRHF